MRPGKAGMTAFFSDRPAPAEVATAHLAELRHVFGAELEKRLARLRSLTMKASDDVQPLREASRVAHGLVGAGGTFGYPEVSREAQKIEVALQRAMVAGAPIGRVESDRLLNLIEALTPVFADHARQDPDGAGERHTQRDPVSEAVDEAPREILMIGRDRAQHDHLARELGPYGYAFSALLDPDDPAIGRFPPPPAGVLVDAASAEEFPGDLATLRQSPRSDGQSMPLIVLSDRDDAAMRLASVRHGSTAFLTKPVDVNRLVEQLQAADRQAEELLRVLIVEDDAMLARLYASVLGRAGMVTQHATKAESVLESLARFRPDLILMDLYLDGLKGTDLAQVIRQHGDYLSVPILFLSAESNLDAQLFARAFGADDFLTKPIAPPELVSAVRSRALRYRELRRVIERDPLTGLLNHSHLRGRLEHDLARTERLGGRLSYAMIDIDILRRSTIPSVT